MELTDSDRRQIISALDVMDDVARRLILATLEAFGNWLLGILPEVFRRIADGLGRLWAYLKGFFA